MVAHEATIPGAGVDAQSVAGLLTGRRTGNHVHLLDELGPQDSLARVQVEPDVAQGVVDARVRTARPDHGDPEPGWDAARVSDRPIVIDLDPGKIERRAMQTERLEHHLVDVGDEADAADAQEHQGGQVDPPVRVRVALPHRKLQ